MLLDVKLKAVVPKSVGILDRYQNKGLAWGCCLFAKVIGLFPEKLGQLHFIAKIWFWLESVILDRDLKFKRRNV